ncbi:MAG: hypothetical protein ACK4ZE_02030 [Sphingorhabdus sp.]
MFQRSPVLSRLLRYLVDETIFGRAATLKSFIIAVDALGRKDDFDSASDSSARVQMGRLRKALETYYSHNTAIDSECIYLQPGSYVIRLAPLSVAYPNLYRPTPDQSEFARAERADGADGSEGSEGATQTLGITRQGPVNLMARFTRHPYMLGIVVIGSMLLGAASIETWQNRAAKDSTYYSPVLEILPIESSDAENAKRTTRLVTSLLANDLSRFSVPRVRLSRNTVSAEREASSGNLYRLYARLVTASDDSFTLYLNIDDARNNVLIWSRIVVLPRKLEDAKAILIPVIGEISGPDGVISSNERVLTRSLDAGGYPCLLKYFEYVGSGQHALENRIADCLQKPVEEQALVATMLGVRAMFELDRITDPNDLNAAAKRGLVFARSAIEVAPDDASANFAMARISYINRDCRSARAYTARTMKANPNSPLFSGVLSVLAPICDYPYADALLDQAIQTQSPDNANGRLLLVLGALSQNRPEKISEIDSGEVPLSRQERSSYYLTEALIAASKGDRALAIRRWSMFTTNTLADNKTVDQKLRSIIAAPQVRKQVITYLTQADVLKIGGDIAAPPVASDEKSG